MKMTLTGLLRKRPMVDTSLEPPVLSWVGLSAGCDWGPARAGPAVVPAAARRAGLWICRRVDVERPPHQHCQTTSAPAGRREIATTMARSSGNGFLANFSTYDAPLPTKIHVALANSWKKARTRSACCGNYGQPGC